MIYDNFSYPKIVWRFLAKIFFSVLAIFITIFRISWYFSKLHLLIVIQSFLLIFSQCTFTIKRILFELIIYSNSSFRVDTYMNDNGVLKKKIGTLEVANRSLLIQVQKLQKLLSAKSHRQVNNSAVQTDGKKLCQFFTTCSKERLNFVPNVTV